MSLTKRFSTHKSEKDLRKSGHWKKRIFLLPRSLETPQTLEACPWMSVEADEGCLEAWRSQFLAERFLVAQRVSLFLFLKVFVTSVRLFGLASLPPWKSFPFDGIRKNVPLGQSWSACFKRENEFSTADFSFAVTEASDSHMQVEDSKQRDCFWLLADWTQSLANLTRHRFHSNMAKYYNVLFLFSKFHDEVIISLTKK